MQWSEKRDQIAAALVQAQSKIAGAEKRSKNPGLRNDYADLDSVWTMIRPALQAARGYTTFDTIVSMGLLCKCHHVCIYCIGTSGRLFIFLEVPKHFWKCLHASRGGLNDRPFSFATPV